MDFGGNRLPRKEAIGMEALMEQYIKEMKLSAGLNRQRVFAAWDEVSGMSRYTVDRFFRDGSLYITLSSSLVRNQLYFQRDILVKEMNEFLAKDSLFTKDMPSDNYVKTLILR